MSAPEKLPDVDNGLLRFLTCGSVDDGKSTLIGRLLFDTKTILADTLTAIERTSNKRGLTAVDLSLLTDGLQAEREQGITIDVAYRYFTTGTRKYIIADAPGHEQYTRNMAVAASNGDVAVLMVDAARGVRPQTHRHLTIGPLCVQRELPILRDRPPGLRHDRQQQGACQPGRGRRRKFQPICGGVHRIRAPTAPTDRRAAPGRAAACPSP